jgi:hypothetical protein
MAEELDYKQESAAEYDRVRRLRARWGFHRSGSHEVAAGDTPRRPRRGAARPRGHGWPRGGRGGISDRQCATVAGRKAGAAGQKHQ